MTVGADGYLHAINPEAGYFGVAPGTNAHTNPNVMDAMRRNTMFTNTMGMTMGGASPGGRASTSATAGRLWSIGKAARLPVPNGPAAHPNSRYTVPAKQVPCLSPRWEDPGGVPISAFIFGGRRVRLAPSWFTNPWIGNTEFTWGPPWRRRPRPRLPAALA